MSVGKLFGINLHTIFSFISASFGNKTALYLARGSRFDGLIINRIIKDSFTMESNRSKEDMKFESSDYIERSKSSDRKSRSSAKDSWKQDSSFK